MRAALRLMGRPVRWLILLTMLASGSVSASDGTSSKTLNLAEIPGELDLSYGLGTGRTIADMGGTDEGLSVALQSDGKIIVAGSSGVDFAVARLLVPDGTFDPSFGGGTGKSLPNLGGSEGGQAVALQSDGKIVVAGFTTADGTFDFAVARLNNPEGTLDTAYGDAGWSRLNFLSGDDRAYAVTLQPDGKIIVVGNTDSATNDMVVARLNNPAGSLDTSYGGGFGWSRLDFGGVDTAYAVALQADGKIIVAGSKAFSGTGDFAVARLLVPEGTFDPSFGAGTGRATIDFGGAEGAEAVAVQADGKIVVAGGAGNAFAVARLLPTGELDGSFGTGGKANVDFAGTDSATSLVLQADGKIIVAGTTDEQFGVARLQPNGTLDNTFGTVGKTIVDFGGVDYANAMALQPDGKIVVAGSTNAKGTFDFAVARLQGDPAPAGGPAPGPGAGPPICATKPATIIGTEAADTLTGTPQIDVIVALGGRDTIRALGGSDIVCAGLGNDIVFGGRGKDRLRGEKGSDRLVGGPGADRLIGGLGRDRLIGGPGVDQLQGGPGVDFQQQ